VVEKHHLSLLDPFDGTKLLDLLTLFPYEEESIEAKHTHPVVEDSKNTLPSTDAFKSNSASELNLTRDRNIHTSM
jgi:hypothetical protein